jgi:hypothetical protein
LVVTPSTSTGTVKILDHPWTLDLVLRRSRNTCRSDGSTKSKDLERGSAPSLNSLAPVEVAKSRNDPAFAMASERAKIGAEDRCCRSKVWRACWRQPCKSSGGSCSGVRRGKRSSGRGCEFELQFSNLFLHLLQEIFSLGSHGGINLDRSSSVNDEGLKSLITVRQCLVRK